MTNIIENPDDSIRPIDSCIVLKEYDCIKDTCPLWENGMCCVETTGSVLSKVFNQFQMLLTVYQSLTKEQKGEMLKQFLGKALNK